MSATAEYYGWLLSQGYGSHQLSLFADYAKRADRGEISHNKAYRLACKAGFKGVDGWSNETGDSKESGEKGGFGDWMQTAKEAGWIDAGLGIIGGLIGRRRQDPPPPPPPPKKDNTLIYVGIGVAIVSIGVAIYFITRKKQ